MAHYSVYGGLVPSSNNVVVFVSRGASLHGSPSAMILGQGGKGAVPDLFVSYRKNFYKTVEQLILKAIR